MQENYKQDRTKPLQMEQGAAGKIVSGMYTCNPSASVISSLPLPFLVVQFSLDPLAAGEVRNCAQMGKEGNLPLRKDSSSD